MRWDRGKERRGKAEGESGSGSGSGSGSVRCRECAEHAVHFMLLHCLSFLTCLLSFFLSFSIYKTSLPFGSILQFSFLLSFHNHMCPPMCPLLSLSSSQGSLLAPIPHSHAPFREAIYHIYLHSKSLSCPFPFVIFFISILLFLPLWLKLFC